MSKYHCIKCNGLILPDFDQFKVGDTINCMLETRLGPNRFNQTAFKGKITFIKGDMFDIQKCNSRKFYEFSRYEVTPDDAPGPIEYFRIGKCKCSAKKEMKELVSQVKSAIVDIKKLTIDADDSHVHNLINLAKHNIPVWQGMNIITLQLEHELKKLVSVQHDYHDLPF